MHARKLDWRNLPLWVKVLLVVNVFLIVAVGCTGWLTYKVARDLLRSEIIAGGRNAVRDFAAVNRLEFLDDTTGRLNLTFRANALARGNSRVVAVRILGRDNDLLASAGEELPTPPSESISPLKDAQVIGEVGDTIAIAAPVVYHDTRLGTVIFDFNSGMLSSVIKEILLRSLVIVSTLMSLSAIFLILLLRRLMRPVVQLGEAAERFATGQYSQRIDLALSGDEVGRAARSFNNMLDKLELHMRFSNGALVDRIRRGGIEEAREFQLTVAFGDARGYTSWSQQRSPPEVFSTLSRYFTTIGRITVDRYQGIIDKFIGDGIMSHFGLLRDRLDTQVADPESVRDALRAIITAQLAMRVVSHAIRTYDHSDPLDYRFGIASGRCLVGPVGARDVMLDYSVIGNVVNLASRLEHLAPAGGLLIDRFTFIDAGPDFVEVLDGGKQTIKGVSIPIQVFFVRGFVDPAEHQLVRSYLLDAFFDDDTIDSLVLNGRGTKADRVAMRDWLASDLAVRPQLAAPEKLG